MGNFTLEDLLPQLLQNSDIGQEQQPCLEIIITGKPCPSPPPPMPSKAYNCILLLQEACKYLISLPNNLKQNASQAWLSHGSPKVGTVPCAV